MSLKRLAGKAAIVTGGGSGIGRAVCQVFAREGASVAVLDIDGQAAQETLDALIQQQGGTHCRIETDVTDVKSVEEAFRKAKQALGKPCDVLVNSAGISRGGMYFCDLPVENFDAVVGVNLRGTFLMSREFVRSVKGVEGKSVRGNLINVTSIGAKNGFPTNGDYAATKAGIVALTKTIAREFPVHKVRCNAIMPGLTDTPMSRAGDQDAYARVLQMVPFGRVAQPEEIANGCLFLASEESSYMHGACLEITGGL